MFNTMDGLNGNENNQDNQAEELVSFYDWLEALTHDEYVSFRKSLKNTFDFPAHKVVNFLKKKSHLPEQMQEWIRQYAKRPLVFPKLKRIYVAEPIKKVS